MKLRVTLSHRSSFHRHFDSQLMVLNTYGNYRKIIIKKARQRLINLIVYNILDIMHLGISVKESHYTVTHFQFLRFRGGSAKIQDTY